MQNKDLALEIAAEIYPSSLSLSAAYRYGSRSCEIVPWSVNKALRDTRNILTMDLHRGQSVSCGSVIITSEPGEKYEPNTEDISVQGDDGSGSTASSSVNEESFFDACDLNGMITPLASKTAPLEAFFSPMSYVAYEINVNETAFVEDMPGAIIGGSDDATSSGFLEPELSDITALVLDSDITVHAFVEDNAYSASYQTRPEDVPVPETPFGVRSDLWESFGREDVLGSPRVTSYELDLSDQKTESMVTCNEVAPIDQIEESQVEEVSAFDESKVLMPDDFPIVWESAHTKRRVKKMGFFRRLFCCGASSR